MFKRIFTFFFISYLSASPSVQLGIDQYFEEGHHLKLKGKRIGIVTNHTGLSTSKENTLQVFQKHCQGYKIVALFAPEHGIDGMGYANAEIKDSKTKGELPIFSLHGQTRRPTKEMLTGIDVLIYHIQDIGTRSYTYATTLFYVMEEAAKHNIEVIVLDRPNPINGLTVDGPMLGDRMRSYTGYINIPYCHGMTIGELANFFNEEYKVRCPLKVIPMKGWRREMTFRDTGLMWVPTSPNIPESDSPIHYATTGILGQLSIASIGIGYTLPFKVVGAPWIDANHFAATLNQQNLPGVHFLPFHYRPHFGLFKGLPCHGVKICVQDLTTYRPLSVQYFLIGLLKSLYPNQVSEKLAYLSDEKTALFNNVIGNSSMINFIKNEKFVSWKLIEFQMTEREEFLPKRRRYLLY